MTKKINLLLRHSLLFLIIISCNKKEEVTPKFFISKVDPIEGLPGKSIKITGRFNNLADDPTKKLMFGDKESTFYTSNDSSGIIWATVPEGYNNEKIKITLQNNGESIVAKEEFQYMPLPKIVSFPKHFGLNNSNILVIRNMGKTDKLYRFGFVKSKVANIIISPSSISKINDTTFIIGVNEEMDYGDYYLKYTYSINQDVYYDSPVTHSPFYDFVIEKSSNGAQVKIITYRNLTDCTLKINEIELEYSARWSTFPIIEHYYKIPDDLPKGLYTITLKTPSGIECRPKNENTFLY